VSLLSPLKRDELMIRFEMVKGVHLTIQPFAEEVLTPTLKVKRYVR
jgi:hypothetical protein